MAHFSHRAPRASFRWNQQDPARLQARVRHAQRALDEAVLAVCDEYVPVRTGALRASGRIEPGGGAVSWNTPYAARVYHTARVVPTRLRGGQWFARAKAEHAQTLTAAARRAALHTGET